MFKRHNVEKNKSDIDKILYIKRKIITNFSNNKVTLIFGPKYCNCGKSSTISSISNTKGYYVIGDLEEPPIQLYNKNKWLMADYDNIHIIKDILHEKKAKAVLFDMNNLELFIKIYDELKDDFKLGGVVHEVDVVLSI